MEKLSINARVKAVRKANKLSQADFGKKISLKQGGVSYIEQEGNTVTEQNIILVAKAFNVNADWLRTGKGEMSLSNDDSIVSQLVDEYKLNTSQVALIKTFLSLTNEQREAIVAAVCKAAQAIENVHKEETKKEQEKRNEAHRLLDMELDAEEKGLSVSTSGSSGMGAEKEA